MTNNDCLRRLRYIFDCDDTKMIALFALAEQKVTREQISGWLKRDEDPELEECSDVLFATFMNGLIVDTRGKKPGPQPPPETRLNNNIIFRKLKIALNLQAEEILEMLASIDVVISKHELSAFFRRPGHKHYRECKDQLLRNFLKSMQLKYRDDDEGSNESVWG